MQDEHVVAQCTKSDWCLFAVCDGHGGHGAVETLKPWIAPTILAALLEAKRVPSSSGGRYDEADVAERLQIAIADLDTRLFVELRGATRNSGTTLVLAAYNTQTRQLFVANVGDSRAVVADIRDNGRVLLATTDHSAKQTDEVSRIRSAGGHVTDNRVAGVLSPSRALGDFGVGLKRLSTTS